MQPEIKRAALGTSRTAENKNTTSNRFSLSNLNEKRVSLKIGEKISIRSPGEDLVSRIKQANTFINPKYESNEKQGYSNWQTSRTIETYQRHEDGSISAPRGFLPDLLKLCEECNVTPSIEDFRAEQPAIFPALKGVVLRPYQQRAVEMAMEADQGVIVSPTGSGKSLIGLEIIRERQQKSLIIVHRKDLADQWARVIQERLGIEAGFIGDGQWRVGSHITIALIQSLAMQEQRTKELSNVFGIILGDEIHHAPMKTFFDVLGFLSAKYRYGLSATPNRRDGLEPMIYRAIGPIIAKITKDEVEGLGATVPATVIAIKTGFNPGVVNSWTEYLDTLTANADRNMLIINLAQQAEGAILILVDRVAHAEQLSEMLSRRNIEHVLAHGKIAKKDRENVIDRIRKAKITVGTTGLLGEGIDVSVWGTLIMASPISSEIKLLQAIGRIVRPDFGKEKALVYDLKDDCAFSGSSFNKRFDIYNKNGIWVQFGQKPKAA
jgi:superfamily II DNA or RNA helicase